MCPAIVNLTQGGFFFFPTVLVDEKKTLFIRPPSYTKLDYRYGSHQDRRRESY